MTIIFIGRSGSGKGTQAELLIKHLESQGQTPVVYIETGRFVRELVSQPTYSGRLAKVIMEKGGRQPNFIAIHAWSDFLLNNLTGGEHLVFDGTSRSLVEAEALNTAIAFYKLEKPLVIFLDVSADCARARLAARRRGDDDQDGIDKRLAWFERDVVPVLDYYHQNPAYRFCRVNGEEKVETIHEAIKKLCA